MTHSLHRPSRPAARIACALLAVTSAFALDLPAASAQDFCEQDGLVVIQVESTPPAPGWAAETISSGYTGSSYYRWDGGNQFSTPGVGTLSYAFNIEHAGSYSLRIRNKFTSATPSEGNDCWTRIDGGTWTKTVSATPGVWT
ncbi:MAG: hypothetical protein H6825_02745 [Planctomycetes bacterium]|nr:hypothetical protein [Planctomycetota bacterium]